MTKTLSERGLLATLNVSQWAGRKYDKRESAKVTRDNGAVAQAARVNKNLLPMREGLEAVHAQTNALRQMYLKHTLPWMTDGTRILAGDAYMEFTQAFRAEQSTWWKLVEDFLSKYPMLRHAAETQLNGLFDDADYPTTSQLREKFDVRLDFLPIPDVTDWRVDVGDAERKVLEQQIEARLLDVQGVVVKDCWRRIYEVVSKAQERLSKPDGIFHDTLVGNAVELCGLLPKLNITDDPELERMRRELEASLCVQAPATLRADPAVRSDTAQKMDDLMRKMGAFYTPPK